MVIVLGVAILVLLQVVAMFVLKKKLFGFKSAWSILEGIGSFVCLFVVCLFSNGGEEGVAGLSVGSCSKREI